MNERSQDSKGSRLIIASYKLNFPPRDVRLGLMKVEPYIVILRTRTPNAHPGQGVKAWQVKD